MSNRASCSFAPSVPDYLSGQMPDDQALAFETHLDHCTGCLALLAEQTPVSADPAWLQTLKTSFRASLETSGLDVTLPENQTAASRPRLGFRYSLTRTIGSGGSGEVWEAIDHILDRRVAVKLLRTSSPSLQESQRLIREASALARLSHTHIVSLHEIENSGERPALIMEFVSGPTLATWLRGQPADPVAAARLLEQLCDALEHAHAQGVVHRDLKPSNVLLKPLPNQPNSAENSRLDLSCWCPKIADFGLARLTDQTHITISGQPVGTPSYMAPEQVAPDRWRGVSDELTDIYGLGTILYELITGRPPFISSDPALIMAMILREDPLSPRSLVPTVPRNLETICQKCLQKEPEKRYQSATEVRTDLVAFLENRPITARPVGPLPRLLNWCRRHPYESIAAAACTTLLVAITIGSLWYAAIEKRLRQETLSKTTLLVEKQQLQEQEQEAVRAGFDRVVQSHFIFNSMLSDSRALDPGAIEFIRHESLKVGAELALQYLSTLDQRLRAGRKLSVEQLRTAIDSLIIAMQAGISSEFETHISTLKQLVAKLPAESIETTARLEMEIRICNLQAGCFAKANENTKSGDAFCDMASLIRQQALTKPPSDPYRLERLSVSAGMLLNARAAYSADHRSDLALKAVRQAEQSCEMLLEESPPNLEYIALLLEVRLALAQLLPPDEASQLAQNSLELAAQTQWNSAPHADKARSLQEQFRMMIELAGTKRVEARPGAADWPRK
jgi:serine/threonine protein kinase